MKYALALALAGAVIASPAAAKELKKLPEQLDPTKAYVLVEMGTVDDSRAAAQLVVSRYDSAARDVLGHGRSQVELDRRARRAVRDVTVRAIVKQDRHRLHLLELEPDLYVVEGANDTAFSLGSRTFRAVAGTVTDLGVVSVATDYAEGEGPDKISVGDIAKIALLGVFAPVRVPKQKYAAQRLRTATDLQPPALLAARVRPVTWEAQDATFGNHIGNLVNRMGGRAERAVRTVAAAPPITARSLNGLE